MKLLHLAEAGDVEGTLGELAALTPKERAAQADALEERRAQMRADWGRCSHEVRDAQVAAELGCRTDPVAAADWIMRGENVWTFSPRNVPWLLDVLNLQPVPWRAELVAQLAERSTPEQTVRFDILEPLLYDAGCPVPTTDGFIASWLSWRQSPHTPPPLRLRNGVLPGDSLLERLRADALTPKLLPLVLDRPAIPLGLVSVFGYLVKQHGLQHVLENRCFGVLNILSTESDGLVDRAALIRRFFAEHLAAERVWWPDSAVALTALALTPAEHASVSRERLLLAEHLITFLLEDSTHSLAFLRALALTPAENAPRLRDHVAVLDLSVQVAAYGQEVLIGLEEAGLVEADVLTEVCERVLLRPEKKLVRAQLAWLNRVAKRDAARTGRILTDAVLTFQHSDVGLQERALDLVARHLPAVVDEQVLFGLREAATTLNPGLTQRAAELLGPSGQDAGRPSAGPSDEVLPDILPQVPEPAPVQPVGRAAEVALEVSVLLADRENVVAFERALDGLVRHARLDRTTLSKALEPVMRRGLNLPGHSWTWSPLDAPLDVYDVAAAVRGDEPRPWHIHLREKSSPDLRDHRAGRTTPQNEMLKARLTEAIELIESGAQPYLLALPTHANGAVDAAVLVARIAEFESLGVTPAPVDLAQALLRVTPTDDKLVRDAVSALRSDAGRRLARWLDEGGAPHRDTMPDKWPTDNPTGAEPGSWAPADPCADQDLPLPPVAAALLGPSSPGTNPAGTFWLAQLPHHRDEMAARLRTAGPSRRQSLFPNRHLLPRLMEMHGTAGYATHWQIARRLDGDPKDADVTVDALLVLAAQKQLDARLFAAQLQALLRRSQSTPTRATAVLRMAAETGAWATVWSILEAALPALLRDKPVNGAGAILALAIECAAHCGAKGSIREVDEIAARKGSSQTMNNARVLRDLLRR